MQKELIALFSHISVPGEKGAPAHLVEARAINMEAAVQGFTLAPDVIDAVARSASEDVAFFRRDMNATLAALTGSNVEHKALYNRFPYDTPDDREYMVRRISGYVQNITGNTFGRGQVLSCGHFVSNLLFPDLSEFSACPICQQQVDELSAQENIRHDFKGITPLRVLRLADFNFVREQAFGLLSRNSSLSLDERHFVRKAIDVGIFKNWNRPFPDVIYRENLPFVYLAADGDLDRVRPHIKSATDILRIAAYLSFEDADLTLREPTNLKLKTSDRKALMLLADEKANLPEDMLRHRQRWLKFSKHVGAGSPKVAAKYPRFFAALQEVHKRPGKIETFGRTVEAAVRAKKIDERFLDLLVSRPGEFMRKLDFILRNTKVVDDPKLIEKLASALPTVNDQLLVSVWKYLDYRGRYQRDRVFIPAGNVTKLQTVSDTRLTIKRDRLQNVRALIEDELLARYAKLPAMGNVFIDPELKNRLLPFNRRADSSSSVPLMKGNAYQIGEAPVVRLFVYWKGAHVDVDLSAVIYDADFQHMDDIYYRQTQLADYQMAHSGDIQRAPKGASEFIDFSPEVLARRGVRYLLTNAIVFTGGTFDQFECFGGFMIRDDLKSGQKFEPSAVQVKFDINTKSTNHMTLAFDCVENRVIYLDLVGKRGRHQNVANQSRQLESTLRSVVELTEMKPTYYDVLALHAKARGRVVINESDADFIVTPDSLNGVDVMNREAMAEIETSFEDKRQDIGLSI